MTTFSDERPGRNWIAYRQPIPHARLRLFCFPFAGGAASTYQKWQKELPPSVEVCPVQLPGREMRLREPFFDRLPPLTEALAVALRPYLDLPYAFFGHSLGALIAFALGRHLRREGGGPRLLIASGRRAPHLPPRGRPVHLMSDADLKTYLLNLSGTPPAILDEPELWQLLSPVIRADFAINEKYQYEPEPPLDCPILAIGGHDDWLAREDELQAWRIHTQNQFTHTTFPGSHFFINSARSQLIKTLTPALLTN